MVTKTATVVSYRVKENDKLYFVYRKVVPNSSITWDVFDEEGEELTHEKEGEKIIKLVKEYEKKRGK